MQHLDPMSPSPLYEQIKQILKQQIRSKKLKEGDLIPSENELCEQYNVSSTTVRRALRELVDEGFIRRRPGIGSFVSSESKNLSLLLLILGFEESDWRKHGHYFSDLMGGIAKVTWERQAVFAVAHVPTTVQDISGYLYSMIDDGMFDGILLRVAGDLDEELLTPFVKRNFPYVAIKRYLPHRKINCVTVDDMQGAFMATEHLIKMGHRRIGLIVTQTFAVGRDRYQGYRRALQSYGIPFDPALVIETQDFLEESGNQAAAQLIAMRERPTAIFAPSDVLAFGVYQAVSEAGLRIPEDIAIVGYDDIPAAALVTPPLSTIRTPYFEFGARSAELLLDIITQQQMPPQQIEIDHSLLARESSAFQLPLSVIGEGMA